MEESNNIELKSVEELKGYNFFIPDYQRGYRWTPQHVQDLLNDIDEFINKNKDNSDNFYCIQPLVIKKTVEENYFIEQIHNVQKPNVLEKVKELIKSSYRWEVIDGQQRLTTILILLSYFQQDKKNESFYNIEYETRETSKDFIENISIKTEEESKQNIDFYHIYTTYETIKEWFKGKKDKEKNFLEHLLEKVKFIWYEVHSKSNSIEIFNRLNIGKISLTNSELIKALLLNRENFENDENIINKQKEIASQWDNIEYTLQNDEFWLFLNNKRSSNPTRIDMIFNLIFEEDKLEKKNNECGNDKYRTFHYFYKYFKSDTKINTKKEYLSKCWKEVKKIFDIFYEWFNDLELYHYIGYIFAIKKEPEYITKKLKTLTLNGLLKYWDDSDDKYNFIKKLKNLIKEQIKEIVKDDEIKDKRKCIPLLLLHNIQTIIIQNNNLKNKDKYKQSVFYKFPFHLYKKEDWDVEHICSYTDNDFSKEPMKREYLSWAIFGTEESKEQDLQNRIKDILEKKEIDKEEFDKLKKEIETKDNNIEDDDKNKIWNFVLLDSSTNRSYGNAIFAAKRRIIIGKDQGIKYYFDDEDKKSPIKGVENIGNKEEKDNFICFIPTCTKNVFLKYYTPQPNDLTKWTKEDAENYRKNIDAILKEFL